MAHATRFVAVGLVLFAVHCGSSPEPEPKTASEGKATAAKPGPAPRELDVMKVARALAGK